MKKLTKNTKALLFLWGITLVSCLIIFRRFIFGNEFAVFQDVGADTLQQYIMQYNSIINALRDGNLSLWDFTNGFGTSLYALNLFQPLLFLLYLAGAVVKPIHVPYLLVFFEIGQIFLAATVFFFYLKEFGFSVKTKVIAAYLYGFNGYLLVWGQHYQFGLYVILLPLLLLLLERALKKRRFSFLLALAVSLTVLGSVYMSYMTLLAVGLYLFFRTFFAEGAFRERAKLFFMNCGSILLGIGMIMAVFLPSASYLMNISSRLDSQGSLLERFLANLAPYSGSYYETAFYRLFSSNLCGVSENYTGAINYYEAPVLFIGLLFIFLFFQYLFTIHRQDTAKRTKAAQYIALILSLFFVFNPAGSMIFNAFAYAFSRHTFVIMPFAALIMAFTLDQIFCRKRLSYAGLFVSLLLFGLLYFKNSGTVQASTLFLCLLGLGMGVVLILGYQKKFILSPVLVSGLLLALVMTNMIYDSFNDYNNRNTLKKTDGNYFEQLYGNDVTAAINYLKENDSSFYRVEKDYDGGSYCMDALTQNYFGVSTYNSAPNRNIQEFVNRLWPGLVRMSPSMYSYRQGVYDAELASLMNIKYLLSHNPSLDVEGFSLLKQFGTIYVYQNENAGSIGKFYTNVAGESEIPKNTSQLDMDRYLTERLILEDDTLTGQASLDEYALEKVDYTLDNYKFSDESTFTLPLDQAKLDDYERAYVDFTITFKKPAVVSISLNSTSTRYITGDAKEKVHVRMRVPKSCDSITVTSTGDAVSGTMKNIRFYGSKAEISRTQAAEVNFSMPAKDTLVSGTVNASMPGALMVTIPYEEGWSAYVDGAQSPIYRADYGFSAIYLSAGDHEITFRYEAPGLKIGLYISAACVVIFLILLGIRLHNSRSSFKSR